MSLVQIRDSNRCPGCGRKTTRWDVRRCINCHVRIVRPDDSPTRYPEFHPFQNGEPISEKHYPSFWIYFPESPIRPDGFNGWVYSYHLLVNPVPVINKSLEDVIPKKPVEKSKPYNPLEHGQPIMVTAPTKRKRKEHRDRFYAASPEKQANMLKWARWAKQAQARAKR